MLVLIDVHTPPGQHLVDITPDVRRVVQESSLKEGICVLFTPHTTASLVLNSNVDPKTARDIEEEVDRLVPTRVNFHHIYDTPADASGHIKSSVIGCSQSLIVTRGNLLLGSSQGIFLFEFDGPRARQVMVRVMEDKG